MTRIRDEEGSVLVVALILLVVLTVLGISASTNTEVELQISGNDKFHKMAFYAADGGTEAGAELLEQNIEARGFSTTTVGDANIVNLNFWANLNESQPSDANRDVFLNNIGGGRVNLIIYGNTELSTGGAIQLISGYEGKGKGAGASGAYLVHDIRAQAVGVANAESRVMVNWRHMI